uniref:C3H1-type domain-containing protein n=1 Tax=Glossina brevipalpis TaxID=37001 RepID=A0A1A9WWR6_9MUSC
MYVCREFMRGACKRAESECRFAHPQESVARHDDGSITVCMDAVKGRCTRDPCRYFHPPLHLQAQLKAAQSRATAVAAAAAPIKSHIYWSMNKLNSMLSPKTKDEFPLALSFIRSFSLRYSSEKIIVLHRDRIVFKSFFIEKLAETTSEKSFHLIENLDKHLIDMANRATSTNLHLDGLHFLKLSNNCRTILSKDLGRGFFPCHSLTLFKLYQRNADVDMINLGITDRVCRTFSSAVSTVGLFTTNCSVSVILNLTATGHWSNSPTALIYSILKYENDYNIPHDRKREQQYLKSLPALLKPTD